MQNPLPHSHWRHYKSTRGTDHTYEVVGIAKHSETEEEMVVYRPLYSVSEDSWVYGYDFVVLPLSMWYDIVEYEGEQVHDSQNCNSFCHTDEGSICSKELHKTKQIPHTSEGQTRLSIH